MNSQHSEPLRVTAVEACRRVSRLVLSEVGNLLYGRAATLVVGEPTCWRVSVWLGMPTVGPVGEAAPWMWMRRQARSSTPSNCSTRLGNVVTPWRKVPVTSARLPLVLSG